MSVEDVLADAGADVPHTNGSVRAAADDQIIGHFTTPHAAVVANQRLFALAKPVRIRRVRGVGAYLSCGNGPDLQRVVVGAGHDAFAIELQASDDEIFVSAEHDWLGQRLLVLPHVLQVLVTCVGAFPFIVDRFVEYRCCFLQRDELSLADALPKEQIVACVVPGAARSRRARDVGCRQVPQDV